MSAQASLGRVQLFFYGLPALPLAMLVGPIYAFLPNYLTESVGLSVVGIGFALSLTRVWDVVSDPVGGILSDRFGSRALWIAAGLPLSLLAIYFLFVDVALLTVPAVAVASIGLYTGWTLTKLNHDAWGAEVSADYDERTRFASVREGLGLLGFLLVVVLLGSADSRGPEVLAASFRALGWGLIICLPLLFALAVWRVPAGERSKSNTKLKDFLSLFQDRALTKLATAFLLNGFAAALPATLFLDFVGYRLGAQSWAGPLLIVYFVSGVAALPFWTWLSRRIDKPRAWMLSMAWNILFFSIVPFFGPGDEIWFAIVCVLTGISLGADLALPAAIQADLVDVRRAETGRQQTGLMFALLGMLTKLAYALAVLAYPLLASFGFRDAATGGNTDQSLVVLGLLYGAVPCVAKAGAIWSMWNFPIGRVEQQNVRMQLEAAAPNE